MKCKRCATTCVKAGKQRSGKQKFLCKKCNLYQQEEYTYLAYASVIRDQFSRMNRLGCGSNKMARFLGVSINTLQKWVRKAMILEPDYDFEQGGIYDIDELQTSISKSENKIWITYGWNVEKRMAVALHVGRRNRKALENVTLKVLNFHPERVNTDNYAAYPSLLKNTDPVKGKRKANHIEREHRNLRKDIASLIRQTTCFAKSIHMLEARIRWYFCAETNRHFFLK